MKNQFVADINDYFKYGLLRSLARRLGSAPVGVWWMLTSDDAVGHGGKLSYLDKEGKHSVCDNELFKALQRIRGQEKRSVFSVQKNEVIPNALYWPNASPGICDGALIAEESHQKLVDPYRRIADFRDMASYLESCPVLFADPDNGVETKTNSSERVIRWAEMAMLFDAGKSLLIYQHKPQGQSLDEKLPQLIGQVRELTAANAFGIACGNGPKKGEVGFLLVPQKEAEQQFWAAAGDYLDAYNSFARMVSHPGATNG